MSTVVEHEEYLHGAKPGGSTKTQVLLDIRADRFAWVLVIVLGAALVSMYGQSLDSG